MSDAIRGIKGQVKRHQRPRVKAKGLAPTEQKYRPNDGNLIHMRCRSCTSHVLVPEKTATVRCGDCTQQLLASVDQLL